MADILPPSDEGEGREPAKHTKFQKGKSGNPRGRPKKEAASDGNAIALYRAIRDFAASKIEITIDGQKKKVTVREGLLRLHYKLAANGDKRALFEFWKLLERADRAALDGQTGEPDRIIIVGGLPTSPPPEYPWPEIDPDKDPPAWLLDAPETPEEKAWKP